MERALIYLTVILTPVTAASFQVLTKDKLLLAEVGTDISLPCLLSPSMSVDGLDVRWFHNIFNHVVFLLKGGREDRQLQISEFRGRVSLSGGPDTGNLTLTLNKVVITDAGKYHCFVENRSSSEDYEEAFMELRVVGVGKPPLVEVALKDNLVHLTCSSSGWFPEPNMHWKKDMEDIDLGIQEVTFNEENNELFLIKNDILLKDSYDGNLYCGVTHPVTGKEIGTYVKISEGIFPRLSSWAIGFSLLLAVLLIGSAVAVWYFISYRKDQERKTRNYERRLVLLGQEIEWRKVSVYKEPILFDHETVFHGLLISPDSRCISAAENFEVLAENPKRFDTEPCVLATPLFNSGVHYWETEIQEHTGPFWSLGIARETVRRQGGLRESLENGIWAIRASSEGLTGLSSPPQPITPSQRPQIIGTYLDYEMGIVSFYDARSFECLFYFQENNFGPVYPFYYVGTGVKFVLNP
ncbi:butyrophilin subfamily 1 member A1-like [Pelobates fuscus]|uniref:butyrophilin subfamily 1 member A1-like n=1 Tax=Pelobates fuscus TaxID=191477 RepID=UPI002FE4E13F